ncbi:hypothetical protein CsSME_00015275 [Camellia sinensis var. sinensis]
MTESQNSTFKWDSDILPRLLCTDSLLTHPSDLITDRTTDISTPPTFENRKNDFKTQVKTPGVVARLMGLDSLPDPRKVFRRKEDQPNRVCGNCSSKIDNVNLDRKNKVVVQRHSRESLRAKKKVELKNVNQKETGSQLKIGNKKKSRNNIAKKVQ